MKMLSLAQDKELRSKEKHKKTLLSKLPFKVKDSQRQKIRRSKVRAKLAEVTSVRSAPGRPRTEEAQPLLLKAISDIAIYGSGADEKRRSNMYRTIKTLDQLTADLKKMDSLFPEVESTYDCCLDILIPLKGNDTSQPYQ